MLRHVRVFGAGGLGARRQAGFQRGRHQQFQVPAAHLGVLVLALDDFALLGQADLAGHRARGLRQDGVKA
ncbi:hypothetical protein D3C78_1647440 [compost metagenome]